MVLPPYLTCVSVPQVRTITQYPAAQPKVGILIFIAIIQHVGGQMRGFYSILTIKTLTRHRNTQVTSLLPCHTFIAGELTIHAYMCSSYPDVSGLFLTVLLP